MARCAHVSRVLAPLGVDESLFEYLATVADAVLAGEEDRETLDELLEAYDIGAGTPPGGEEHGSGVTSEGSARKSSKAGAGAVCDITFAPSKTRPPGEGPDSSAAVSGGLPCEGSLGNPRSAPPAPLPDVRPDLSVGATRGQGDESKRDDSAGADGSGGGAAAGGGGGRGRAGTAGADSSGGAAQTAPEVALLPEPSFVGGLLSFEFQQQQAALTSGEAPDGAGAVVCRFYAAGTCRRADCWYSHDLSNVLCRYWATSGCGRGDACAYRHAPLVETPPPPPPRRSVGDTSFAVEGVVEAGRGATGLARVIKLQLLQELYGSVGVPAGVVEATFTKVGHEEDKARAALDAWLRGRGMDVPTGARPVAVVEGGSGAGGGRRPGAGAGTDTLTIDVPWVETGQTLSAQYGAVRERAAAHAVARNTCYERATREFRAGHKALAREYSVQGRAHDRKMRDLHAEAARSLLRERGAYCRSGDGILCLDVHGLHVDEAAAAVDEAVDDCTYRGEDKLCVITGLGRHSASGHARLLPGIRAHCEELGIRTRPGRNGRDGRGGLLVLLLRR